MFPDGNGHVSPVFNIVSQFRDFECQVGIADCTWPHIHASAGLSEVQGDTEDVYGVGHIGEGRRKNCAKAGDGLLFSLFGDRLLFY